ncbi:hypothetical protein NKH77_07915 [Streptomyces sp. M19]
MLASCAGYPLVLGIVAGRACAEPRQPLATLAAELRDVTTRLDVLDDEGDPAVSLPAVLSWSLRALTDEQVRVFGLLGIAPARTSACRPPPASSACRWHGRARCCAPWRRRACSTATRRAATPCTT